eukprot:gene3866-4121_t
MVVAVIAQADYSSSYGNKRLSDVTLVIFEEPDLGQRRKRSASPVSEELPGHGVVLISSSEYCRTVLENWASSSSEGKYRLELSVPAGQLELGKLLVKGMYYSRLDLAGYTQQQLLQVLLLADKYEVPRFLAAVSAALESIPLAELQWDTAMAVYNLPPGCAGLEACKCLYTVASAKVQQQLSDLELSKQRPSKQVLKRLLELIRMRHCSQLYVATVLSEMKFVQQCMSHVDLKLAALVASSCWQVLRDAKHPVLERYPAWTADKRPISGCQQEVIDWQVPLSQVQAIVLKCLDDRDVGHGAGTFIKGPVHVWQGREFQFELSCGRKNATADAAAGDWHLRPWLRMPGLPAGAICSLQAKGTAFATGSLVKHSSKGPERFSYNSATRRLCLGWKEFIGLGRIDSWAAALVGLRNKRLVHAPTGAAGGSNGEEFIYIRWWITDLE